MILYPKDNAHVRGAVASYKTCLADASSFAAWTLEDASSHLQQLTAHEWIARFIDRYLAFEKVEALLAAPG